MDWDMVQQWLTFMGVLCATASAFLTAINGTQIWGHVLDWHCEGIFRDLDNYEATSRKQLENIEGSRLLDGSEVVTEDRESTRRGAMAVIRTFSHTGGFSHNNLRSTLELPPMSIVNVDGTLNSEALNRSRGEIIEVINDWIEHPRPLNRTASLWAIGLLLLGGILAAIGTLPLL